jgi:membrane AbrB-like protein
MGTVTMAPRKSTAMTRVGPWLLVGIVFGIAATLLVLARAPSPYLLAGVIAGAGRALTARRPAGLPKPFRTSALALIGVAAGSSIQADVVAQIARQPWLIIGGTVGTLLITLLAGQLLRLSPVVDANTAMLSSIAGGASGLTVMAKELDADETIVAAVQYLRVLVVVVTVPFVAPFLGHTTESLGVPATAEGTMWSSLLFTAVALAGGLGLARLFTFASSTLVLPMGIAAGLAWWGVLPGAQVPAVLLNGTYAVIGLMVGLDLSRQALRRIASLLPLVGGMLIISLVGCAALGIGLSHLLGVSAFSGYLAFTPGGLPAVTAVAVAAGADTEFVVSCQVIRLLLALLAAAVIAGMTRHHELGPRGVWGRLKRRSGRRARDHKPIAAPGISSSQGRTRS